MGTPAWIGAASIWTDQFTVDAPVGQAVRVPFSVLLPGTNSASVLPDVKNDVAGGEYDLLIYSSYHSPQELLDEIDVPDNKAFIKVDLDLQPAYQETRSNTFLAHAGESFYVFSVLDVSADRDQVLDFAYSAHFGIHVGPGATLVSSSGTRYAAAAPELDSQWLAAAGLMVVGLAAVSARQSRHEPGRIRPH